MIEIYTDGSTFNNGQKDAVGGWGAIILENGQIIQKLQGYEKSTTNQRMELTAAISALEFLKLQLNEKLNFEKVILYSDSAYLINCKNQEWYISWQYNGWVNSKKQPVANPTYWKKLIPFFEMKNISFKKVKAHAGNNYNELVDEMARAQSLLAKNLT